MCFSALFLLVLISPWCFDIGKGCSESEVFLRFRQQIFPNNSHIPYHMIGTQRDRLYCYTNKRTCCSDYESGWYFPSGERVLGGYEYDDIHVGVFARSSGYRSIGLYRLFNPQQRGRFSCILPDASGNNCTLFANIVNEIPNIAAQPISQTVITGQNATFSVEVANNSFATYRWQKDNMDLWDNSGRYEGTTTTMLTIFDADEQDEGDYRCIIDNILMSNTAELSVVSDPVVITNNMMELNITSGHDLEFYFNTDMEYSNATVTFYWQKDGYPVFERQKYRGTNTQTLTILDIQNGDEGFYTLTVVMADQNIVLRSFNASISVVTPSIEISPSVTPEIGLQCSLTCTVTGVEHYNPAVTFQWFKNGVMILNATDSVLTIQALKHTDAGEYMCIVNMSSEKLIPSFISDINNTFVICFTLDIGVTIAGSSISNQSLIYFDEITKQDSTSALVCHVNNIIPCDNGTNNSQIGNWYFPNGDLVPQRTATQTISTMFSQRSLGGTELHRFGHPSQTGHYFCTVPSTSIKFYVFIRSHVSLSLRGVIIYNNSYLNFGDIGGIIDDEALQCHTDNVNCCNNELITENGSVLAEWYYPNGSKVLSVDHTDNSTNDSYVSGDGIFTSRSQSVIRLLAGRGSTESGLYCCEILDQYGSSQTVCVNLVSDDVNKTQPDMTCLLPTTQNNYSDTFTTNSKQPCSSPVEIDNVSVLIDVQSAVDVGHSFSMNCIVAGINDSNSLSITHQWYKDKRSIHRATLPTLYFSALTLSDIGSYVCEVAIRSISQGHGIIRSSSPYILNISSALFQIRLFSVQNCIQWTSSAVISRIEDIENVIVSSIRKHCECEFSRSHITDEGFQCFTGSESHVTFRARLQQTSQRSSLELITYLEDIVANARYWLIHGQYLKLNHSCSLVITDIHSPECSQFETIFTSSPPVINNEVNHMTYPSATEQGISCNIGYLMWAISSTFLLLMLMAIFGVLLSVKLLKSKVSKMYSHRSSQMRARSSNTREINTDTNYAYDKEVYQEMKGCSVNDQYPDDDYEEIRNITKKTNEFD